MTWTFLIALLGVGVVGVGAWLIGRPQAVTLGRGLGPDDEEAADPHTFPAAFRGYRMDQVDEVVGRLEQRIAELDRALGRSSDGPLGHADAEAVPDGPVVPSRATGPDRTTTTRRSESTLEQIVADSPRPLRRLDLLAPVAYLVIALYLHQHLLAGPSTRYLSQGVQDQLAFEWYFGAAAHNLVTASFPLFSDLQNFPAGVNLMANASVLGLGVPLAPLTYLAGPHLTFALVQILGMSLTAAGWYWVVRRRLAVHPLIAAATAALCGFAPGLVSHANGHPNFVAQLLIPLIVDRVVALATTRRPVRDGVVLGLLLVWQAFIGEEVLLLTAVALAIAAAVLLAHRAARPLRPALRGLGVAAGVAAALLAVPLWWQFFGPQSYTTLWHPPGGNDLAALWARATRSIGADPWASAALSMNRTEENAFFGIPLWLALIAVVAWGRRSVLVRTLAVVVVVTTWLSLGPSVTLHGQPVPVPALGALMEHLPVLENVLASRFVLAAIPAMAILLALGAEGLRRRVAAGTGPAGLLVASGALAIVLYPMLPTPLVADPRPAVPTFFSSGEWRRFVDDGGSVLPVPVPQIADARALDWQAAARWGFPVVGGYFVGPQGPGERAGTYGAPWTALTTWLYTIAENNTIASATPAEVEQFHEDLRSSRVDALVLPEDRESAGALLQSLTQVLGDPEHLDGVFVWDVRGITS